MGETSKLAGIHGGNIAREGVGAMAHALMEAAVETHVGVAPHDGTATRTGQRNRSEAMSSGLAPRHGLALALTAEVASNLWT